MTNSPQMNESDFHRKVDTMLEAIETALDSVEVDIGSVLNGGILTLEFENGSKMVINRQTPTREIWVATKSGAFHFRFDEGQWRDTRSQQTLENLLSATINEQANCVIDIALLSQKMA